MEQITKWRANDGSEWKTEQDCRDRETLVSACNEMRAHLEAIPEELNWKGYVQQQAHVVAAYKRDLVGLAHCTPGPRGLIEETMAKQGISLDELAATCHPSWLGRIVDDIPPLSGAFHRLYCIDTNYREWNQPFFALNPGQGKDWKRNADGVRA